MVILGVIVIDTYQRSGEGVTLRLLWLAGRAIQRSYHSRIFVKSIEAFSSKVNYLVLKCL